MSEILLSRPVDRQMSIPANKQMESFSLNSPRIARMTAERIAGTCHIPMSDNLEETVAQSFLTRQQSWKPEVSKFDITEMATLETREGPLSQHTKFPRILTDFANAALIETNASWILTRTGIAEQHHGPAYIDKVVNEYVRGFTDLIREVHYIIKSGTIPIDTSKTENKGTLFIGSTLLAGYMLAINSAAVKLGEPIQTPGQVLITLAVGNIAGSLGLKLIEEGVHMLPTISKGEKMHLYTWH